MWIELIRAHARMFLGKADEARKFYLHFQSNKRIAVTNWEMVALQNFEQLRKAGHSHPLMVEIEQKLFAAGWTAQGRAPEKVAAPSMSSDDQYFIIMNPDDIKTAALYAEHGKLDEAKNVYERILENCQARLAKEPGHAETKQTLNIIIGRLALLAQKFIRDGRFAPALECSEKLIAVAPERYRLHAIHTHALMFIGRNDEAEALYLRYRGQKIGDDPWEAAILADFRQFRQAGRSNSLMDKIEALFDAND
jgi:tetratricopeptide (TPR) repeat protein